MKYLLTSVVALLFITKSFACVEVENFKYCKGALVINKSGLKAQITELLPNERAVVQYPQYEVDAYANLKDLALPIGSSLGYFLNDEVMTPHGEAGVISGFFQDGSVAIFINDFWNHAVYSPLSIASREGCTERGFCVGDNIKNKYNKVGQVVAIFPLEEKVFISFPGQERYFKWSTQDLKHN